MPNNPLPHQRMIEMIFLKSSDNWAFHNALGPSQQDSLETQLDRATVVIKLNHLAKVDTIKIKGKVQVD